jgi:CubicO group peptidase (beta-lactamase class C family)
MNRFSKSILTLAALACCATAVHAGTPQTTSPDAATYDKLVDAVVAHYHLPGIAVGVIEHGKVVYKRVEGKLPSGQPMDADTLFEIGSTTKAMTVTVLARLAQQGKLKWDAPVIDYLPDFKMYDPWVTKHMQVKDLLSHHSGLSAFAGDLMLWPHPSHFTPDDVVRALRYLKPAYSFRAGYAYDNVLFVTAGQVAAAAGGKPWAQLVKSQIFKPLGMDRCQAGRFDRAKVGNVARPHVWHHDHYVAKSVHGSIHHGTTMDAAGGVTCSLNGMLTWAKNWLAPTDAQLKWLKPSQRQAEWTPHTPVPIGKRRRQWNDTHFFSNALGWRVSDTDGEMTVWHTGVLSGMRADILLFPYRQSGFVILTNSSSDDGLKVLDEVLQKHFTAPGDGHTVAWYAKSLKHLKSKTHAPVPSTTGSEPATVSELKQQLGVWQDPWFGNVRLCSKGDSVQFASRMSPILTGKIMRLGKRYYVHFDRGAPDAWLEFPKHAGGTLNMDLVNGNADASNDFRDIHLTRRHGCE